MPITGSVIEVARRAAGMSQQQLARAARTAQSSISEYESGRKSPTLAVVERLLAAARADLAVVARVEFSYGELADGGVFFVPDRLWTVPPPLSFARVRLADYPFLGGRAVWDLSKRAERVGFYSLLLRVGLPEFMEQVVDGALLVEVWRELNLPKAIREAWAPLIASANGRGDPVRDIVVEPDDGGEGA